jgi:hypothetical protein
MFRLSLCGVGLLTVLGGYIYIQSIVHDNEVLKKESRQNLKAYVACAQNQKHITEKENEWQKKLASTNDRVLDLSKRLRDNATVCVSPSPGGTYAAASGNELPSQVGISARTIIEEAAACDRNTQQLITLQEFLRGAQ